MGRGSAEAGAAGAAEVAEDADAACGAHVAANGAAQDSDEPGHADGEARAAPDGQAEGVQAADEDAAAPPRPAAVAAQASDGSNASGWGEPPPAPSAPEGGVPPPADPFAAADLSASICEGISLADLANASSGRATSGASASTSDSCRAGGGGAGGSSADAASSGGGGGGGALAAQLAALEAELARERHARAELLRAAHEYRCHVGELRAAYRTLWDEGHHGRRPEAAMPDVAQRELAPLPAGY
jgi:hypothetical protein